MGAIETRERTVAAAYQLFEERGYDGTSVDDIAERAGIGRSTFFRMFGSKEDVIFPEHDSLLASIEARLAGAVTTETRYVAVAEAARLVLLHYLAEGEVARARYRLTRSVPALRAREIAGMQQYQRLFRTWIHRWYEGAPEAALRAELMAAAVVTGHNHVLRGWLRGLTEDPMADFDRAMVEVMRLFAGGPDEEAGTTVIVLRTPRQVESVLPQVRAALIAEE
ncbi:TetR/AcrR family transcriptional regulator [Nocardioides daejeonensis]|uniref:TetR/AcrR family transcriptional regulator n=1 Tax=Nocardioides daejeonensis TaxID=1046556 RepID=UPI000D748A15|nr:TetR/AcrR family transcriptional regulator [Nocardioides daejeonensis]